MATYDVCLVLSARVRRNPVVRLPTFVQHQPIPLNVLERSLLATRDLRSKRMVRGNYYVRIAKFLGLLVAMLSVVLYDSQ